MKVFVYGPLMPNFEKWSVIADKVENTKRGKVKAKLYQLPYGYPAIIEGDNEVYGYVLDLPDEGISTTLDQLFGFYMQGRDNFYEKKNLSVTYEDGSTGEALVYLFEGYRAEEVSNFGTYIPHGDWAKFIEEKNKESA